MVVPEDENQPSVEYLVPKGRHLAVFEGDFVFKGDLIVDGNSVPHDILRILGVEALAHYLINEVQEVYRLQGVQISDKHIEVIVRQMLQKVEIIDAGDSTFMVDELVDRKEMAEINEKLAKEGKREVQTRPVLQGITKASLLTRSFISSASFQQTTQILTDAAVSGKIDPLVGLKENIIVGRLIPAGTGRTMAEIKRLAAEEDKLALQVPPAPIAPQVEVDQEVKVELS